MSDNLRRLNGPEPVHTAGVPFEDNDGRATVHDWWSWRFSDILNDEIRAALAEFLVARLLGATKHPRRAWEGPYDFVLSDGRTVEVKSSANRQSWDNPKPTPISFGVPVAGRMQPGQGFPDVKRHADIYVFCALPEKDRHSPVDPLDLSQWRFFVAATALVNDLAGSAAKPKISIQKLIDSAAIECDACELRKCVEDLNTDAIGT